MATGRFFVIMKSGRKFCVEPYGDFHTEWGNVIPGTKKIEKVTAKDVEVIDETNTIIKKENGYKNICFLDPGTSPMAFLELLDKSGVERIELDCVKYVD